MLDGLDHGVHRGQVLQTREGEPQRDPSRCDHQLGYLGRVTDYRRCADRAPTGPAGHTVHLWRHPLRRLRPHQRSRVRYPKRHRSRDCRRQFGRNIRVLSTRGGAPWDRRPPEAHDPYTRCASHHHGPRGSGTQARLRHNEGRYHLSRRALSAGKQVHIVHCCRKRRPETSDPAEEGNLYRAALSAETGTESGRCCCDCSPRSDFRFVTGRPERHSDDGDR